MKYDIVELNEKSVVGLCARTSNNDPLVGEVIGKLWQRWFGEQIYTAIPNKNNDCSIGLYSDYENDVNGLYDVTVGCEVSAIESLPAETVVKTIPAGRYAQFTVWADDRMAVSKAWQEIWALSLDRTYTGDFEEYTSAPDGEQQRVDIYIAIK